LSCVCKKIGQTFTRKIFIKGLLNNLKVEHAFCFLMVFYWLLFIIVSTLSADVYHPFCVLSYHVLKIAVFVALFHKLSVIILFHSRFYCTLVYESDS